MAKGWEQTTADRVEVGDRVRVRGNEFTVARIEREFLGRAGMIAFVEDTSERWFKVPTPADADVDVLRDR